MSKRQQIPVALYRGGTSKAVFIKEEVLPKNREERDRLILRIFGSPDIRQIDGLGGADPLTSKVAIIGAPSRPDADLDYCFGQVDILDPVINYEAVCGNISAAVGPFAIEERMVKPNQPYTEVKVNVVNIGKIISVKVRVENGSVVESGQTQIDGVPNPGAPITLNWVDTLGANTGKILPTGHATDVIDVSSLGKVSVSIVDAGNIGIFLAGETVGLSGTEKPSDIDKNHQITQIADRLIVAVEKMIGKRGYVSFLFPPKDHLTFNGKHIVSSDCDILVKMIFMNRLHKAYSASQTNCIAVGSCIKGTVLSRFFKDIPDGKQSIRIAHPSGIIHVTVEVEQKQGGPLFKEISMVRTARRLLEGKAYFQVPESAARQSAT